MRLGIDLGGTKLLAALVDDEGRVVRTARRATGRTTDPKRAVDLIAEVHAALDAPVRAVGVGFPGLVEAARGRVRSSIMLDGWSDVPLADLVTARLGVPCVIDNDVNAHALAEVRARGTVHSMLFAAVGTGIGGAIVLDGRLWRGAGGFAGEVGNTTIDYRRGPTDWAGGRGTLNALASGTALAAPGADWRAAAEALGAGLGNAANLLDPELIVVGGGVAERGAPFLDHVRAGLRAVALPDLSFRLEPARAGYAAGALGAALLPPITPAPPRARHLVGTG